MTQYTNKSTVTNKSKRRVIKVTISKPKFIYSNRGVSDKENEVLEGYSFDNQRLI